jgi:hypothetical protein
MTLMADLLPGEIFPTHIRSQGVAWSLFGTFLSVLVYVEAAPTALANITWKYYIIFIGLTMCNILILHFWCPEVRYAPSCSGCFFSVFLGGQRLTRGFRSPLQTKGLSLEEINAKFGDEVVVQLGDAAGIAGPDVESLKLDNIVDHAERTPADTESENN